MKRITIILALILMINISSNSQSLGFSYFFPKDGYFGNPIAPISLNLPVKFGKIFLIDMGFSLNNIGGMSIKGFGDGYKNTSPMLGPFQSLDINLSPTLRFNSKHFILDFSAGGFIFMNFNERLMHGNFDKMIMDYSDYDMINSDVTLNSKFLGSGFVYGSKITLKVKKKIWIYFGGNFYKGKKEIPIEYSYNAVYQSNIISNSAEYNNTYLQYEGFEFVVGVSLKK